MSVCVYPLAVTVYDGLDNDFAVALESADGGYMTSLAGVTRVTLTVGSTTIDSDVVGSSVIWWTDTETFRGEAVGVIKFKLGGQSIAAGEYADCALVVYDTTYTGGFRMANPFKVTVI